MQGIAKSKTKFVVVTGGTASGLGKGTAISSIGVILKARGFTVTAIKIDPYLNIDAGTMSPFEHGEVFVLRDGAEADLDLGNYERWLNVNMGSDNNLTTGKLFQRVLLRERRGDYLGRSVQLVPHVTNEIQEWIAKVIETPIDDAGTCADVCLIEVGGTVGDMESMVYLESLKRLAFQLRQMGSDRVCVCHVTWVLGPEQKTKPTQHSVLHLRQQLGQADFSICRCEKPLTPSSKAKISDMTQIPSDHIISMEDIPNICDVPLRFEEQGLGDLICKKLLMAPILIPSGNRDSLASWGKIAKRISEGERSWPRIRIGIVGKYTGTQDTYLSVHKALTHAALDAEVHLQIEYINSEQLETEGSPGWVSIASCQGVVCPGGFGDRGILGKAMSSKWCRENKIPYLGICLGLQTAVIDIARNVLGLPEADSTEFDPSTPDPVVIFMPEGDKENMGGTMRLGERMTKIEKSDSLACTIYGGKTEIRERHRHRYEVNPAYVPKFEEAGLKFVGRDESGMRMEIAELEGHPYFLCTQFHPEFLSHTTNPSPPFHGLVLAASGKLQKRIEDGVLQTNEWWI